MQPSNSEIVARLKDNIARVRERMAAAATRAGRSDEPQLIAVTKYVEPEVARLLVTECGVPTLAESRPQELWRKAEALSDLKDAARAKWHLIGHLQRNKVKPTLPFVDCIQSVDSLRLIEEIRRQAAAQDLQVDVLLEVNVSGDQSKHGLRPDEVESVLEQVQISPRVCVKGLMAMASLEGGPVTARGNFAALRELRDRLWNTCTSRVLFRHLSMGMSGDFEIAIEEGATMVRVGSALFEGLV
jgi:pyridoxal phosphate enzyme (YggS family)